MDVRPGYKQTEVGVIPEDWRVSPLFNLIDPSRAIRYGIVQPGKFDPRGRYMVRGQDYSGSWADPSELFRVSSSIEERYANARIKAGDVLITIVGASTGRVAVVPEWLDGANLTQTTARIAINKSKADSSYCRFVLSSWYGARQVQNYIKGGAQPGLNCGDIEKFLIPLPPTKAEQEAIAEALSDADALIESLEQLIAKKRQVKQGAMQELLTGKRRLPGFSGEWEVKTLGELFTFIGGLTASREQLSTEGHCYLHYGDIHTTSKSFIDVRAEIQDIPKLDVPLKKVSTASLLNDGDIVFVDASEDEEGTSKHVVIVNPDRVPFISGLHTIVAKSKTAELAHNFRRYCFQTKAVKTQFRFFAVGTKVSGISKANIAKITLPVPAVPEQTAISAILSDMDAEIAGLEAKLAKACQVKQGMMQELLTGRIRLVPSTSKVVRFPVQKKSASTLTKSHNWQINEAVIIAVLVKNFGSEEYPLARKRCTKLTYLLHRHVEGKAEGYLKKAAGPYNPRTRYSGPEAIAQKNGYIHTCHNGTYEGFVVADNITQAEDYFRQWYGPEVLAWLEQFRYRKTDELELLATVDMAMEDLRAKANPVALEMVKQVIREHPEWEAKLGREIFSDANIERAVQACQELFV